MINVTHIVAGGGADIQHTLQTYYAPVMQKQKKHCIPKVDESCEKNRN
jgi:hypothetical protein